MSEIPGHSLPTFTEDSRDDALFHYTTADGLIGILQSGEIWSTAYYCSNDESELAAGKGVLTQEFLRATHGMIQGNHSLVQTFSGRGVDILEYARKFEENIISHAFHVLCAYMTCFCKPTNPEDFHHGLLSQWRAYGVDGGYALQFSKKKLLVAIEHAHSTSGLSYELHDVHYVTNNPLKEEVLKHKDAFLRVYENLLNELGGAAK